MHTTSTLIRIVPLLLAVGLVACDDDTPRDDPDPVEPEPEPEPEDERDRIHFVLGPRTVELDDTALSALQGEVDTAQVLRFDADVGERFTPGDVLLAGVSPSTPHGLLRLVLHTARDGDIVEVVTEQAPLQLAFLELDVHVERTLDEPLVLPPAIQAAQASVRPLPIPLFDEGGEVAVQKTIFNGDDDVDSVEDQHTIDDVLRGQVGVTLDISFDWGSIEEMIGRIDDVLECAIETFTFGVFGSSEACDFELPELRATFNARATLATTFDHQGAASVPFSTGTIPVGEPRNLPAIVIGPLVFLPTIGFDGEVKGSAGSYMRVIGNSRAGFDVSVSASTSPDFDVEGAGPDIELNVETVDAFLDGRVETEVGPTVKMLAYGAIGPRVGFRFTSVVDVDRSRAEDDCYRASVGGVATYGFEVRIPWREVGTRLAGSAEIGETLEDIGRFFGLDGPLLDIGDSKPINEDTISSGPCGNPPPGMLPPGAPQDDTLANPPFTPWAAQSVEDGRHFDTSTSSNNTRTTLTEGVDGHLWVVSTPSPTLRRFAIDGRFLSAARFIAPIPDSDREAPLPVVGVLQRTDLTTWVLFDNGVIGRLDANRQLVDAFRIDVDIEDREAVALRRGATREDGRTALVYGVRDRSNSFDNRMILVELDAGGVILRARSFGADTAFDEVQHEFLTNATAQYLKDGALLLGGDSTASADANTHCAVMRIEDDGAVGFATELSPGGGSCQTGAVTVASNDDIVVAARGADTFGNDLFTILLSPQGAVRSSSRYRIDGDNQRLHVPQSISRLSTTGYLVAGREVRSATEVGVFIARLDGQGAPLSGAALRTPSDVDLGLPDAFVTRDGGVVYATLADWRDVLEGRDVTSFLIGKAFAKDGSTDFNATSEMTSVEVAAEGNALTTFPSSVPYAFEPAAARYTRHVVLRQEEQPLDVVVFAP